MKEIAKTVYVKVECVSYNIDNGNVLCPLNHFSLGSCERDSKGGLCEAECMSCSTDDSSRIIRATHCDVGYCHNGIIDRRE